MMLPQFFGFEMTPKCGFDFIAGEEFLDRYTAWRREGASIVLAVDVLDDLP